MESKSNLIARSPLDSMAQTPDLTITRKLLKLCIITNKGYSFIMKNVFLFLLTILQPLFLFSEDLGKPRYIKTVSNKVISNTLVASDEYTKKLLHKERLSHDRNFQVEELIKKANHYMNEKNNPLAPKAAQEYIARGMKKIDLEFNNNVQKINCDQSPKELQKVKNVVPMVGEYDFLPDTENEFLDILSIQVDKFNRVYGGAIVYENFDGEMKIVGPSHSFYRDGEFRKEIIIDGEYQASVNDFHLSLIAMNNDGTQKEDLEIFDVGSLNCKSRYVNSIVKSRAPENDLCYINLSDNGSKKTLKELYDDDVDVYGDKFKVHKLITNEDLRKNADKIEYYMVAVGVVKDGKVHRTKTKCEWVDPFSKIVKHKCNTDNNHSGGGLYGLLNGEYFLVASHSARLPFENANYAIRIDE